MHLRQFVGCAALFALGQGTTAANLNETVSPATDREAMAVTVYQDEIALVKERRQVRLPAGRTWLSLVEVASHILPETAILRVLQGSPIDVLEQSFNFDPLTPATLLAKNVGREVTVVRSHPATGEERCEKAILLAADRGPVLRFPDRIEIDAPGRIVFDHLPAELHERPTLSALLEGAAGIRMLELSYLASGLSWQADYVAMLTADRMDLSGWMTLTNDSTTAYEQVTLQLVAGKINRIQPQRPAAAALPPQAASRARVASTSEALLDYHLYGFERPISLSANQTKQLALLSANAVPVRRQYLLAGSDRYYRERLGETGQKLRPAVFVEFTNTGGQLGKPMPSGIVRFYARDSKGNTQFVGEDRIDHTAKDAAVKLKLGEAFDITATRIQTAYKRLSDNSTETSYRIELHNAKDGGVTVRVQEPLPGDWEIVQETHRHSQDSAHFAVWNIDVPAGGATILEYTARVRW